MKKIILFVLLISISSYYSFGQDNELLDKIEQYKIELEKKLEELKESVNIISEANKSKLTYDDISSIKSDISQDNSEQIEARIERLLTEIEELIERSNLRLKDELIQIIEQRNMDLSEETEQLIINSEEKTVRRTSELIDNKISEFDLQMMERLEGENQSLRAKIDEQESLLNELLKRIEKLENKK